jgi:DNA replication protein DnaC
MESITQVVSRAEHSLLQPKSATIADRSRSPRECEDCAGDGWIQTERGLVACTCQIERRIERELPARYRSARIEDFSENARTAIEDWTRDLGDGLFLCGGAGVGKTHLAAAIVRSNIECGRRASFRRCAEVYAALREAIRIGDPESAIVDRLVKTPLLVMDDLGSGSLSDHERRSTLEVLDQRANALLPTVVTSNWTIERIGDLMDERIRSRLSAFTALELQGRDRRAPIPAMTAAEILDHGRKTA